MPLENEKWLATDGKRIWSMEHEGDYTDNDTVICVKVIKPREVELSMGRQDMLKPIKVKVTT